MARDSGSYQFLSETLNRWSDASSSDDDRRSSDSDPLTDTDHDPTPEFGGFVSATKKTFEKDRLAFVEDPRFGATLARSIPTPGLGQLRAPAAAAVNPLGATALAVDPRPMNANPMAAALPHAATLLAPHPSHLAMIPPPPPRRQTTGQFGVAMSHHSIVTVPPVSFSVSTPTASPPSDLMAMLTQVRALASKIPLPIFFPVGAMVGILFAMIVVITTRSPSEMTSANGTEPARTVSVMTPAQPVIEGARSLVVDSPSMVTEKTTTTSSSATAEDPAPAAAPVVQPRARTVAHRAPAPQVTRRAPASSKTASNMGNLLAAGL